ncbi:RICIN domain-containing protein [Kitasatospora sp. NPDC049258]|uniref:RICIN domain-containing protein n=1 Tax=Kitasatospora sp. NPDC049258 TaxID=3155394 RepID=UPI0034467499
MQRPCAPGAAQTWRRTIDSGGYFTLRLLGTGSCLTMPGQAAPPTVPTPAKVATTAAALGECREGDPHQQWWMPSALGTAKLDYRLQNRATRQNLQIEADGTGAVYLRNARTGLYLQVNGAGRQAILVQKPHVAATDQQFVLGG